MNTKEKMRKEYPYRGVTDKNYIKDTIEHSNLNDLYTFYRNLIKNIKNNLRDEFSSGESVGIYFMETSDFYTPQNLLISKG